MRQFTMGFAKPGFRITKRFIIPFIALGLIGAACYFFLYGKLFPFTPVLIGFDKTELQDIVIYHQKGSTLPDLTKLSGITFGIEKFHALKYTRKPELIIFRDSLSYIRRSPSKARFCAFPRNRLFISPWAIREASEGKISLNIYLKHELSHILIFQHKGFLAPLRFPKWLLEGIAVYSSEQMGTSFYPDKQQTIKAIAQGNFVHPSSFKTRNDNTNKLKVKNPITFAYSEYACMVDYLILKYGKARFLSYMNGLLKSNDNEAVFRKVYGEDFSVYVQDFIQYAAMYGFSYSKPPVSKSVNP